MKMKPTPKVNVQMLEPQTDGIRTIDTTGVQSVPLKKIQMGLNNLV